MVKNQINSPAAHLPQSPMLSFFYLPSFPWSLIFRLSFIFSFLIGAHCQGSIKTTSLQGLCPCVSEGKKRKQKKQSQSRQACVLWLLYPTDTTQHAAFFHTVSPNKLRQVQKGRSPWKKYILTKTFPSRDNNHINNSPLGASKHIIAFKFNPQVKSESKIRCQWLGGVDRGGQISAYMAGKNQTEDGNK